MVENNCECEGKVKKNNENGNFKLQSFPYVKIKHFTASWKQTRWEQKTSNCGLISLLSLRFGKVR